METDMTYQTLVADLRRAYREARRHKTGTGNCVRCQMEIEEELDTLARTVIDGTYEMRPGRCFIVSSPVMREIVAADFRDRIIHHYIFEYLNPHLERELIDDCYSCRTGKGTGYGVDRLEHHIRSCSQNYTRECWALQLDISGYFMSIDRQRLYTMAMALMARIARKTDRSGRLLGSLPRHRFVGQLLAKVILYDPLANCEVRDPDNLYARIPRNKTLRYAAPGTGLPIGNLTSQMFSNLYMNGFDQWVKRCLKVRHYGRYVDDTYFLSADRRWLESLVPLIGSYLESHYSLKLNLRKTKLTEVRRGVTFLGIRLKPYRRYVRTATLTRMRRHIDDMRQVGKGRLRESAVRRRLLSQANSMLGILGRTASFRLRGRLFPHWPLYAFAHAARGMRKFLLPLLVLATATAAAQRRYSCTGQNPGTFRVPTRGLPGYPRQDWDPERTYRQLVLLVSFSDCDFSMDGPACYYDRILNRPGYNEGAGPGSAADYFRDQSGGRLNLQFDVCGPVRLDVSVKTADKYGSSFVAKALKAFVATAGHDCSPYDWDGDGYVDQVVCILAGFTGNLVDGYAWPCTSTTGIAVNDSLRFGIYSLSCELWPDGRGCGIGTVCHEFSHCLGLPDIYPVATGDGAPFSVVDEWDLMDGGNFTGRGWCPPNYSALEKMLLGWTEPRELTAPTTVRGMECVADGGEAFIIRHPSQPDEYFLLENRRRTGWDYGLPGEGLLVAHVDYDRERWFSNTVNSDWHHYCYDLVHADDRDYRSWDPADNGRDPLKYTMEDNLRNHYLSTSAYPWVSDSLGTVNRELTDTSVPAAVVYEPLADGSHVLSRPVTDIRLAADGTVSFDFMHTTAVKGTGLTGRRCDSPEYYDILGRRLPGTPRPGTPYIKNGNKYLSIWK